MSILPRVNDAVNMIQTSDTAEIAERLERKCLEAYSLQSVREQRARIFLGSVSVGLCIYIISLVYRLRRKTAWLTRRLDYEEVIKEIGVCFEGEGPQRRLSIRPRKLRLELFNASLMRNRVH